jgi:mono/diheme cytochrome c family protein
MQCVIRRSALGMALLALWPAATSAQDSKQVSEGAALYTQYCVLCHGADGRGGAGYANPIWGQGAQIRKFKNALGLFEYNQLLMPFNDPTLLTDEQKWLVVVYILANHNVIRRDEDVDPQRAHTISIP